MMEQEKLAEAQRFLQEDSDKFEKQIMDEDEKTKDQAQELKKKMQQKQYLNKEIESYHGQLNLLDNKIKKHEDDLIVYKQLKRFLDVLAIQAGKKKYQMVRNDTEKPGLSVMSNSQSAATNKEKKQVQQSDSVFMTQTGTASPNQNKFNNKLMDRINQMTGNKAPS